MPKGAIKWIKKVQSFETVLWANRPGPFSYHPIATAYMAHQYCKKRQTKKHTVEFDRMLWRLRIPLNF
jgi:hypothetical protein